MTDERLIEEARRWPSGVGPIPSAAPANIIKRLADALEAAEKAHTPTDEERVTVDVEALDRGWGTLDQRMAGTILAVIAHYGARWREASGGDQANEIARALQAGGYRRPEPQGEASDVVSTADLVKAVSVGAVTLAEEVEDLIDAVTENIREAGAVIHINEDEPYMGDGNYPKLTEYVPLGQVEELLRAALRAASEVGGEGR